MERLGFSSTSTTRSSTTTGSPRADVARHPAPDVTIDRIGALTTYDMPARLDAARQKETR